MKNSVKMMLDIKKNIKNLIIGLIAFTVFFHIS